jgi:hypothetical protein
MESFEAARTAAKEPALYNNPLTPRDEICGWITFQVSEGEKPKFVIYSTVSGVAKWSVPQ